MTFDRRQFLRASAVAAAGTWLPASAAGLAEGGKKAVRPIIAFSKPFQHLGPDETAALVASIGWDGIECPVRAKGQIEPSAVKEQLPRFADAFRRRNLDIPVLVTDIVSLRQPHAEDILAEASRLGIRRVRLGFYKYAAGEAIEPQVQRIGGALREIGEACAALGLEAGVENHSGSDLFGAPVWDILEAIRSAGARHIGVCFDIGHAAIEGGLSWPIQARLAAPSFVTIYVKDFLWQKGPKGWRPRWCPLGEGAISPSFVTGLVHSGYAGPICQHHEYPLAEGEAMLAQFRRDLRVLKEWLAA